MICQYFIYLLLEYSFKRKRERKIEASVACKLLNYIFQRNKEFSCGIVIVYQLIESNRVESSRVEKHGASVEAWLNRRRGIEDRAEWRARDTMRPVADAP